MMSQHEDEEKVNMQEVGQDFKDAFRILWETISTPKAKLKWDAFVQKLGDAIDASVLERQEETGEVFLGGTCTMSEKPDSPKKTLLVTTEEYFQDDETGKNKRRTSTREVYFSQFDMSDAKTKSQIDEIHKTPYVMEIQPPQG